MHKTYQKIQEFWPEFVMSAEDDKTWNAWLKTAPNWQEAIHIIRGKYKESFKARILLITLTPDFAWLPFPLFATDSEITCLGKRCDLLEGLLGQPLLEFAADAILIYKKAYSVHIHNHPKPKWQHSKQIIQGFNKSILELLALLNDLERKRALFNQFSLTSIFPVQIELPYSPFTELLYDPRIADEWKELADREIREIVKHQAHGHKDLRKKGEYAPRCYAQILARHFHSEVGYSSDLFASQLEFFIPFLDCDGQRLLQWKDIPFILSCLPSSKKVMLTQTLARAMLTPPKDLAVAYRPFEVGYEESINLARRMLEVLDSEDETLKKKLRATIVESQSNIEQREKVQQTQASTIDSILEKMRA